MAEPFLSEIRMMSFSFAPTDWALCDGQELPINQNIALFALIGTMYGGDGISTFKLPDLRGRVPIHFGDTTSGTYAQGWQGGEETHQLTIAEMPAHTHPVNATSAVATATAPSATRVLAQSTGNDLYGGAANLVSMDGNAVTSQGGDQAHANMMPYLTISFCIALTGIFPDRD
jgi:microcystin-dependent protein